MLDDLWDAVKGNVVTLIITIFLCIALVVTNFWLESLLKGRYYAESDVMFLAFFISIFFFASISLTLEQNNFSSIMRIMLPLILSIIMWVIYTSILWLMNAEDILDSFRIYYFNTSWYYLAHQIIRIFQTAFIILSLMLVRFIWMDVLRASVDDRQSKIPMLSSLQAIASSAISAIALFMFVPTMLMSGLPFFALIFIFMFLFYHAYWNYSVFMSVSTQKGKSTWWMKFVFIQLIAAIVFILFLIVIIVLFAQFVESRDVNKVFATSISVVMNLMMILQEYVWAIFIVGVIMVSAMNFFSKSVSYRVLHWVTFISLLSIVLFLTSFDEAWLVTALITFMYGFICCLYAGWNKLVQLIVLGRPCHLN